MPMYEKVKNKKYLIRIFLGRNPAASASAATKYYTETFYGTRKEAERYYEQLMEKYKYKNRVLKDNITMSDLIAIFITSDVKNYCITIEIFVV